MLFAKMKHGEDFSADPPLTPQFWWGVPAASRAGAPQGPSSGSGDPS